MATFSIYKTEFRASLGWHIGWFIAFASLILTVVLIYPGEEGLEQFKNILDSEIFQLILGNFLESASGYTLWVALMLPFYSLIVFIYAIMTGVRIGVQSISDKTGELMHTLPVKRSTYLMVRLLVGISVLMAFYVFQTLLLSVPVGDESIPFDRLLNISVWGFFYGVSGLSLGMVFGMVAGNSIKGYQLSIVFVIITYVFQLIANYLPDLASLNDLNPLALYQPSSTLFGVTPPGTSIFGLSYPLHYSVVIILYCAIFIPLGFFEFKRKDLSDDAGLTFKFLSNININRIEKGASAIAIIPRHKRNNPIVAWARVFEKRLPFTADFIYSDVMTILIVSLAILMFFPLQLLFWHEVKADIGATISGFGSSPVILIFTYGHFLASEPYLWFVISQTIGIAWFFMVPVSFFWIRKAIRSDGNTGTGELLGSIPVKPQTVMLQRLLAVIILLVIVVFQMVFWLVLSEVIIATSYNQVWEIIATLSMIPLYLFLITFGMILANIFKEKGGTLSIVFLAGIVLMFAVSILTELITKTNLRGIFGLYDPVLIIQEASITANGSGVLILIVLSILSTIGLIFTARKFTWLNISDKANIPK